MAIAIIAIIATLATLANNGVWVGGRHADCGMHYGQANTQDWQSGAYGTYGDNAHP